MRVSFCRSDITDAVKKSMPYKMEKYLLIAKAHVPKGGSAQNPVFVNDEEELFFQVLVLPSQKNIL